MGESKVCIAWWKSPRKEGEREGGVRWGRGMRRERERKVQLENKSVFVNQL